MGEVINGHPWTTCLTEKKKHNKSNCILLSIVNSAAKISDDKTGALIKLAPSSKYCISIVTSLALAPKNSAATIIPMSTFKQKYNPSVIIKAVYDKLSTYNLEGGQHVFQLVLLNWIDNARESVGGQGYNQEEIRKAIATLWLAYAHFLIEGKQFKSATKAYKQAVNCKVAGSIGRIWLDYVHFAEE